MAETIHYKADPTGIRQAIAKKIGAQSKMLYVDHAKLCYKLGVPTNDVDIANANNDICYDATNNDLYAATNVVAATTTTWTKIVD